MNEVIRNIRLSEIFDSTQKVHEQFDVGLFISALLVALLAAFAASFLYRFFYERRGTGSQVHRAFPLLALAITTLFIGVQISIPLSLGLLGSLSIIRFRTPIKEPEEVGFIMLVIAASISAATFNFQFVLILYIFAFITLLLLRGVAVFRWVRRDGILVLTRPSEGSAEVMKEVEKVLAETTARRILESTSDRSGIVTCQYVFSGLRIPVAEFQERLSKAGSLTSVNIFLDRPGGIR